MRFSRQKNSNQNDETKIDVIKINDIYLKNFVNKNQNCVQCSNKIDDFLCVVYMALFMRDVEAQQKH